MFLEELPLYEEIYIWVKMELKKIVSKKKLSSPSNFASHFWVSKTNYYTNKC